MHTLLYFNVTLSDNEIASLAQASSLVHTQPNCRCPPSHPIVRETTCIDTSGTSQVPRVNSGSRHVSLLNDDSTATWWQSEVGVAPVNVTVSLAGLRVALLVAINFRDVQPKAMILYYSNDGGISFTPRQYYASNCSRFGLANNGVLRRASDVNCVTSLPNNVFFRVLDVGNRPEADFYPDGSVLRDFSLATHVRLELIDWNVDLQQEQYFAISEILVGGEECVCNGHADSCTGSTCECQHNTTGTHCEQCLPLFNDKPWEPGTSNSANPCEMCECNHHANACVFSTATGSGQCINCTASTTGSQCEICLPFFYNPQGLPLDSSNPCLPCGCEPSGTSDDGVCELSGINAGQCSCKTFAMGRQCDTCQNGYYNLSSTNPDGCTACECNTPGTVDGSISCNSATGQCMCKNNVVGRNCSSCALGHYGLENQDGCLPCDEQCNECSGPGATRCVVSWVLFIVWYEMNKEWDRAMYIK